MQFIPAAGTLGAKVINIDLSRPLNNTIKQTDLHIRGQSPPCKRVYNNEKKVLLLRDNLIRCLRYE